MMKRGKGLKRFFAGLVAAAVVLAVPFTAFAAPAKSGLVSYKTAIAAAQQKYPKAKITQYELDYEKGRYVYDLEFVNTDRKKYDIKVDAASGKVIKTELDGKLHRTLRLDQIKVGYGTAVTAARKQVPGGSLVDFEIDWRNKMPFYEVELKVNGAKKKVVVNATDGTVPTASAKRVSEAEAGEIAVKAAGGGTVVRIELDEDDGRYYYDVKVKLTRGSCEVEVDAETGKVLDVDYDD